MKIQTEHPLTKILTSLTFSSMSYRLYRSEITLHHILGANVTPLCFMPFCCSYWVLHCCHTSFTKLTIKEVSSVNARFPSWYKYLILICLFLKKNILFSVRWPPFVNLSSPGDFGLNNTRNFYMDTEEDVRIGAWYG